MNAHNRMLLAHRAAKEWRREVELALRKAGVLRTLEDMSEEQIAALEKQYNCRVKRPGGDK